jgi:hypothetical protein
VKTSGRSQSATAGSDVNALAFVAGFAARTWGRAWANVGRSRCVARRLNSSNQASGSSAVLTFDSFSFDEEPSHPAARPMRTPVNIRGACRFAFAFS